jgi:P-type conjugative transfer protein TrbG
MPRLVDSLVHASGAVAFVALLTACNSFPRAPRMGPEDYPNAREPLSRAPASGAGVKRPVSPDVEFVEVDSPELSRAMKQFVESGNAPVIRDPRQGFVRFPYGQSYPLLYCKPLRVCDLELQSGESVLDVALGDTEFWHAQKMESGPAGLRAPHVIFKPVEGQVSTNAVITTDRRTYHIGLIAVDDPDGQQSYFRQAGFYYPDETVTAWMSAQQRADQARRDAETAAQNALVPEIPRELYHGYEISGATVPWRPVNVFDDGTRVYIQMPTAMYVTEAPGLWVIDEHGQQNLVNYRVRDGHYIVDKLFSKARMAVGVGSAADEVYITRRKPSERKVVEIPNRKPGDVADVH